MDDIQIDIALCELLPNGLPKVSVYNEYLKITNKLDTTDSFIEWSRIAFNYANAKRKLLMSLEQRLATCKQYREEALKHPKANKLYIEDLNQSIAYLEGATKRNSVIVGNGWVDNEEA